MMRKWIVLTVVLVLAGMVHGVMGAGEVVKLVEKPDVSGGNDYYVGNREPKAQFKVTPKEWPRDDQPFDVSAAPIELEVRAKKIPGWKKDHLGLVGSLQESPAISNEPVEMVRLIPMGCARLRISAFPTIGSGAGAHEWVPPEAD
jgi:hypothetical protein